MTLKMRNRVPSRERSSYDLSIVGDRNGDGIDTIGRFNDGVFELRNSNTAGSPEIVYQLGAGGHKVVSGRFQ